MKRTCDNCFFSRRARVVGTEQMELICHRHPPVPVQYYKGGGLATVTASVFHWPRVDGMNVCGEHRNSHPDGRNIFGMDHNERFTDLS